MWFSFRFITWPETYQTWQVRGACARALQKRFSPSAGPFPITRNSHEKTPILLQPACHHFSILPSAIGVRVAKIFSENYTLPQYISFHPRVCGGDFSYKHIIPVRRNATRQTPLLAWCSLALITDIFPAWLMKIDLELLQLTATVWRGGNFEKSKWRPKDKRRRRD